MKIMIMTDLEGVAGVLAFDSWTMPGGAYYDKARAFLTAEANAAIAGFAAGGFDEFLVVDGHGPGGLDPESLDERAILQRAHSEPVWPWCLDKSFAALAHVGQHAKAGTSYSHLTHTSDCSVIDLRVNDLSIGEYGMMVLCAAELGIPSILAAGECAFAEEAKALAPGVETAVVKWGLIPECGNMDSMSYERYRQAKMHARHLSPFAARRQIEAAALRAAERFMSDPQSFICPKLDAPYKYVCRHRSRNGKAPYTVEKSHNASFTALLNSVCAEDQT